MKKGIISALSVIAGATTVGTISARLIEKKARKVDKFKQYYNVLNSWLTIKQEGKSLETFFIDNNYKEIAIYGMGEMGKRLYDELKDTSIIIKYAVDKDADNLYTECKIVEKEDKLEVVDAIIVTAIFDFERIEEFLESKVDFEIISLEDVVYEV